LASPQVTASSPPPSAAAAAAVTTAAAADYNNDSVGRAGVAAAIVIAGLLPNSELPELGWTDGRTGQGLSYGALPGPETDRTERRPAD
jgi:hypothetical protein